MQIASREARLRAIPLHPTPIAFKPFHLPEVTSITVQYSDSHIDVFSSVEMRVEVHGEHSRRDATSPQFSISATSGPTTLYVPLIAHDPREQPPVLSKKQTN